MYRSGAEKNMYHGFKVTFFGILHFMYQYNIKAKEKQSNPDIAETYT